MSTPSDFCVLRKQRLLREFDLCVKYSRPVLVRQFGEENVQPLAAETRQVFESLIPQLPYIGGRQPFTEFIVFTAMILALYRVDKGHGRTLEETGELSYEIGRAILRASPTFLMSLLGKMNFSRVYLNHLRKRAIESRQRKYPEDYVYDFVEGDGKTFDYGVDYVECASCKFLSRQDSSELARYICPVDILYSERLGWGLMRTMTLAEGAERCDFRFKKGGTTRVAVPLSMQHVVTRGK